MSEEKLSRYAAKKRRQFETNTVGYMVDGPAASEEVTAEEASKASPFVSMCLTVMEQMTVLGSQVERLKRTILEHEEEIGEKDFKYFKAMTLPALGHIVMKSDNITQRVRAEMETRK